MVHKIMDWLAACPNVESLSLGTLSPGTGTGLFPKGISKVYRDILGGSRVTAAMLLHHRDHPDSAWAQQVADWVLRNQPEGMTVTPKGGKLCSPTRDGLGTWEMELVIENCTGERSSPLR